MVSTSTLSNTADKALFSRLFIHLYQQKVGSIFFAAVNTKIDVAFAASRLGQSNIAPTEQNQLEADRVLEYLYNTRSYALQFGGSEEETSETFISASNTSFADNSDRKSLQGFIMKLFGGTISWKICKQATVTTSSTEAELLVLSQTAREAMYLARLFKAMKYRQSEPLTILCDNLQTIQLITEDDVKLSIRLRHVDIHNHWLRQGHKNGKIRLQWVPTAEMPADGLTKALSRQKHKRFVQISRLVDIAGRLADIRQMKKLKEDLTKTSGADQEQVVILADEKTKAERQLRKK